jgi:integrase
LHNSNAIGYQWWYNEQAQKMRTACKKAGIEPATFRELRHAYAFALVNRGCVLYVAQLLGHASTAMTERHYAHPARSSVRGEPLRTMPRLGILERGEGK